MALKDHLSVNSTVVVTWDSKGKPVIRGNKTESAGVLLVESMGFRVLEIRGGEVEAGAESTTPTPRATAGAGGGTGGSTSAAVRILRQYPFTAERKMMSTLVALDPSNPADGPVRLYVTGAAFALSVVMPCTQSHRLLVCMCVFCVVCARVCARVCVAGASEFVLKHSSTLLWPQRSAGRGSDAASRLLPNSPERSAFLNANVIEAMAKQSLRTLGLAYRDYGSRSELPANWGDAPADWKHGEPNVEQVRATLFLCAGEPLSARVALRRPHGGASSSSSSSSSSCV
jgi:magnesium-transporting ATPase (P-type)